MITPHSYEHVYNSIRENSECELLSKDYKNNRTKLVLGCKCGEHFETTFGSFMMQNSLRVCARCRQKIITTSQTRAEGSVKLFVSENSNCQYISGYKTAHTKMTLLCNCGNQFKTNFINFRAGKRYCNACRPAAHNKYSEEQVSSLVKRESDCVYVSGYTTSSNKFLVRCACGEEFETLLSNFRAGKKQCLFCSEKRSKGEKQIERWLTENAITYETEKRFEDCRNKRALPFDFFLPTKNMCIEYDGEQHYRDHRFAAEGSLREVQNRDGIKNRYCEEVGITLLRISYKDYLRINDILHNHVNTEVSE